MGVRATEKQQSLSKEQEEEQAKQLDGYCKNTGERRRWVTWGSDGSGEARMMVYWSILKVAPTGSTEELGLGMTKEEESRVTSNNWKNDIAIY